MLSVGDISGDGVCRRRLETLNCMFGMYPEGAGSSAAKEIFDRACKDLETIRQRLDAGEQVRIWYSSHPDEMCGLHWFLTQLVQDMPSTKVSIVKLPDWEIKEQTRRYILDGVRLIRMNGTGMQICKKRCPQFLCLPLHRNGDSCRRKTLYCAQ